MSAGEAESGRESHLKMSSFTSGGELRARCAEAGIDLPVDDSFQPGGPMSTPLATGSGSAPNRWAILPMEGWDGTAEGRPTEFTRRRWRRFGQSGAGLIWGGEAVAVRHDGRANPNQLVIIEETLGELASLREELIHEHQVVRGAASKPVVGLQLTHSGRWSRPHAGGRLEPWIAYRHPLLDRRVASGLPARVMTDSDLDRLVDDFVVAGERASRAGFDFVDIKHCHGYLGHELLSAVDRPGRYGGTLENRCRFLRSVAAGLRSVAPGLGLGVRLSLYDSLPFGPGPGGVGRAEAWDGAAYPYAFGGDGVYFCLDEPAAWLTLARDAGVQLICTTAGSPYHNPHLQRPAAQPPSDGYLAPEDPLRGVARQIQATATLKRRVPGLVWVGSAYSYLQEWIGPVAQAVVTGGMADMVGLGRLALSYPQLPLDLEAGLVPDRKRVCRTLSDCTTAPRNGLISGCYPLDPFYKSLPQAVELRIIKENSRPRR